MPAIKKSVRLTEDTQQVCRTISRVSKMAGADEVNWSGSLNVLAKEYLALIEESKPELTEQQWNALYCVYNGYMPGDDARQEARLLHWHISEGYQYDEQVREFLGAEKQALSFIEEIKGWPISKQLSAIYHAKAYWTAG